MDFHEYLKTSLKDFQNKRFSSLLNNEKECQIQRRRSSRLQNLMALRKINEATLSPIFTPIASAKKPKSKSSTSKTIPENNKVVNPVKNQKNENNKPNTAAQNVDKRRLLLLKWKEEKQKKIEAQKNIKKPIFKVSHCSSLLSIESANQYIKGKRFTPKSKLNSSHLYKFAPENHVFKPPANVKPINFTNMPNVTKNESSTENSLKSKRKLNFKTEVDDKKGNKSFKKLDTRDKMLITQKKVVNTSKIEIKPTKNTHNYAKSTLSNDMKSLRQNKVDIQEKQTVSKVNPKEPNEIKKKNILPKFEGRKYNLRNKKNEDKSVQNKSKTDLSVRNNTVQNNKSNKVKNVRNTKEITVPSINVENKITSPKIVKADEDISLKTPKTDKPAAYISPFITLSRGKTEARKEYKQRLSQGGTYDNFDSSKNTSPKAAASYFTNMLENEINEIHKKCNFWNEHKQEKNLPDGAIDMIDVAIGQSNLLINQKLQQFKSLIKCAQNGEGNVTCYDLHGFWDLVYIQINNVRERFENLEKLKDNNWEEIICNVKTAKKTKSTKRKIGRKNVDSKIKNFIEVARQKKKLLGGGEDVVVKTPSRKKKITTPSRTSTAQKSILKSGQVKSARKSLHKSVIFDTSLNENENILLTNNFENRENDINVENLKEMLVPTTPNEGNTGKFRRSSRLSVRLQKLKFS